MTLPRDLSGDDLVRLLERHYGYKYVRQRGSHMMLCTSIRGEEHSVAVPRHRALKIGTLNSILAYVAEYLGVAPAQVRQELFGR